jgi:hypothetical protein
MAGGATNFKARVRTNSEESGEKLEAVINVSVIFFQLYNTVPSKKNTILKQDYNIERFWIPYPGILSCSAYRM